MIDEERNWHKSKILAKAAKMRFKFTNLRFFAVFDQLQTNYDFKWPQAMKIKITVAFIIQEGLIIIREL